MTKYTKKQQKLIRRGTPGIPKYTQEQLEERRKQLDREAEEQRRQIALFQGALDQAAEGYTNLGPSYKEAQKIEEEERLKNWRDYKLGVDATMRAAELASAGYGVIRGAGHLFPSLSSLSTSRYFVPRVIGKAFTNVDYPQLLMNTVGGVADGYQLVTADNTFDKIDNGAESVFDTAGIVGATNVVRSTPFFGKYRNAIDTTLDAMGYTAAGWDLFKVTPWGEKVTNYLKTKHE